nr:hypothetical protein [Tanacetum cinerariifolium]
NADIADYEERLGKINGRGMHQSIFTSRTWRRLFNVRGPLVHELILEFFSTFRFRKTVLNLDTVRVLQFQLDTALPPRDQRYQYLRFEGLEYTNADIADYEERLGKINGRGMHQSSSVPSDLERQFLISTRGISTEEDFLGTTPSYTAIRDLMLRLCYRLITYIIAGRSQAPEKVTVTNLFYLRYMDVDSVNILYLLAQYLRRFALGKKQGAMIYRGSLLFICEELDDTWAWVALGLDRQSDATAGAPEVAEGALDVDEGAKAVPAPVATCSSLG